MTYAFHFIFRNAGSDSPFDTCVVKDTNLFDAYCGLCSLLHVRSHSELEIISVTRTNLPFYEKH